jgi:outer membrane receptor protein involved in Fe transport
VTNYEVGLKSDVFDKKVSLDLSAYWIDWTNIQVQQSDPATATSFVGNGPKAVSKGVEASGTWTPTSGLQVFGNLAYQNAEVAKDFPAGGVIAKDGDRLPLTPRWSSAAGWDYSFPLPSGWNGTLGGDWRHVGETQGAFPNPGQVRFVHPAYDVFNLRAGVSNDRLSFTLYLKNIGNDLGQTADVNFGTLTRVSVIQPRTLQLVISTTF